LDGSNNTFARFLRWIKWLRRISVIMRATQINLALGDALTGTPQYKSLQIQKR
jgi:hypothetical protein